MGKLTEEQMVYHRYLLNSTPSSCGMVRRRRVVWCAVVLWAKWCFPSSIEEVLLGFVTMIWSRMFKNKWS